GVLCGWLALQKRNIWFGAAAGVLFGFAYLTRPEGIGFVLVFVGIAGLVWLLQLSQRQKSGRFLGILVLSLLGFIMTALPYWIFLHAETGTWTISTKGAANQQGEMYVRNKDQFAEHPFHCLNSENTVLLQDEIYHTGRFLQLTRKMEKAPVTVSRGKVIRKVVENLYQILTGDLLKVLSVPLLLLLGLGLFARPWCGTEKWLNLYLLAFVGFYWFVLIPAFHITIRYFIPLLPLAFIWVSRGIWVCGSWFTETFSGRLEKKRLSIQLVGILVIGFVIFVTAILPEYGKKMSKSKYSTDEWAPAVEQKKAGLWLRENEKTAPVIMAYNHAVSFYAGNYQISESVEIPDNAISRLLDYAEYRQVDYLVLNDRYLSHHPKIVSLYSKIDIPAKLELVYDDCDPAGLHTLIYKFNK
ncbi:hypothetical protein KAH55_01285, partial [bacterium]|nr:hypothetical protein [bacterium]